MRSNPRAVAKLQAVRSGHAEDTPSARNPFELFAGAIVGVLIMVPPLILVTLSVAGVAAVRLVPAVLLSVVCAAVVIPLAWRYYRDETANPYSAVRYFMLAALTGHSRHAYEMLAEVDKDDTPRATDDGTFKFDSIEGFRAYWDSIRDKGGGIGRVVIRRRHEVTMLDDDLALVKFSLGGEDDKISRHQKLAIRVSNEWHLFNGEWSSPEDEDTSWTAEAEPHSRAMQSVLAHA
jgi:hypothetical protein